MFPYFKETICIGNPELNFLPDGEPVKLPSL